MKYPYIVHRRCYRQLPRELKPQFVCMRRMGIWGKYDAVMNWIAEYHGNFIMFGMRGPSFNPPLLDHVEIPRGQFNLELSWPPPEPLSLHEIYELMGKFDTWLSAEKIIVIPERLTKGEYGEQLREIAKQYPYVHISPFADYAYVAPKVSFGIYGYLMLPKVSVTSAVSLTS